MGSGSEERGPEPDPALRTAILDEQFEKDLAYWKATDPKLAMRLMRIVEEALRSPFTGIGKPEPLRGNLAGYWSRRLTQEHRVVYLVTETTIQFARAYGHY